MAQRARPEPASASAQDESATLTLPPISDAAAAPGLKETLSPLVLKGVSIRLMAGEVERITTACMQVLIAADRALALRQAGLIAREVSAPMRQAFAEMGLSAELDRWVGHG